MNKNDRTYNNILEAIGQTPLVKLNKVAGPDCADIYVKCEFLNPTGSIKDRMAYHIITEAEKRGELKPGATIVENTSGNTGLGVAMAAAVKGYRCVFTMPDKMSQEKINMLKSYGAEVIITPTDVPGDSPQHYVNVAKRVAAETSNGFYVNQYHSKLNIDAHYHSTGKEIWDQTGGEFDVFIAGTGTGGTISGVGKYIKERSKKIKIVGVDPLGSVHFHYFYTKTLPTPHVYKVEGIGEDILCDALEFQWVDEMRQVNDKESFLMARRLIREEGLFCGGSSGSTAHIAVQIAKEIGPGKKIVCVLTDSATRYITKYLSDAWMRDYGFMEQSPELGNVEDILKKRKQKIVTASPNDTIEKCVAALKTNGITMLPILDGSGKPSHVIHEVDILRALQSGKAKDNTAIKDIAHPAEGLIYPKARIEELYHVFQSDKVALVVDESKLVGIISKIDLIEYLSNK